MSVDILDLEFRNPFTNAKVVGAGIDSEAYHRPAPGIDRGNPQFVLSRSELMMFASCPSRWVKGYAPKDTAATRFGSLIDCLVTDAGRFKDKYIVEPETVTATASMKCVKEGKVTAGEAIPWQDCAEAREWNAAHAGLEILSFKEHSDAVNACQKLMADEKIREVLDCSDKQVMVVGEYKDRNTGIVVPVKSLIDFVPRVDHPGHGYALGDFKTARNAAPGHWRREVYDRNYDCQAAINTDLYVAATKQDRNTFLHVIMENVFPFQPARRLVGMRFMGIGRFKYHAALALYCECLQANKWPDWDDGSELNGWGLIEPDDYMVSKILAAEPLIVVKSDRKEEQAESTEIVP